MERRILIIKGTARCFVYFPSLGTLTFSINTATQVSTTVLPTKTQLILKDLKLITYYLNFFVSNEANNVRFYR